MPASPRPSRSAADTTIREHVTINPGTAGGGMITKIGDRCLIMIGVHIGHDCIIGNNVIMSNNVTFAGHCRVDDFVMMSGYSGLDAVRPHRRPRLRRRSQQGRKAPHSVRHRGGQSGRAQRPQPGRPQAPRLRPRGDPQSAHRLPDDLFDRRHAARARRRRGGDLPERRSGAGRGEVHHRGQGQRR